MNENKTYLLRPQSFEKHIETIEKNLLESVLSQVSYYTTSNRFIRKRHAFLIEKAITNTVKHTGSMPVISLFNSLATFPA